MPRFYSPALGKAVKKAASLRGGGSALPGLVIEKIDPTFISSILDRLPLGVILVSGTNGKTTTTKMVVELLEGAGLKVFTNRTGSNFARGVAASLLGEIDLRGRLDADVAVLELDEAHAVHFVKQVPPRHALLLNVMRDQLDRFGEIDNTARLLEHIARATTGTVVLNREDTRIARIAEVVGEAAGGSGAQVRYFGLSDDVRHLFPSDDDLHGPAELPHQPTDAQAHRTAADVTLESFDDAGATFDIEGRKVTTPLKLSGVYNIFNGAAALAVARAAAGSIADDASLVEALSQVTPAFGRGEKLVVDGQPLELILVKNPGGFRLGLSSFAPEGHATMIAINDNYADGRDMSWLWDVDFASLAAGGVHTVSGVRAYDMTLRLDHDDVPVGTIEPDLAGALRHFLEDNQGAPKHVFCTYTAMLALRKELAKITDVEVIS